jgi:hypothetical protein
VSDAIPIEKLVAAYRKLREAIAEKEKAHEVEIEYFKGKLDMVTAELLEFCNEQNVDSIRTAAGTLSRRISTRYWTTDWERFYQFVGDNQAFHLLEKRIHNTNMKQFLGENPDVLPVGLQADSKYVIQVRKPSEK